MLPQSFSLVAAALIIVIVSSGGVIAVVATGVAVGFPVDHVDIVTVAVVGVVFQDAVNRIIGVNLSFSDHDYSRSGSISSSNNSHRSCYIDVTRKT